MVWDSCPLASCSFTLLLLISRPSGCLCQSLENSIERQRFTSLWSQKAPWCRGLGPHKRRHNQEPLKNPIWQIIKYSISVFQVIKILKFRISRVFCIFRISGGSAPSQVQKKTQEMQLVQNTEIPYFDVIVMIRWLFEIIAHTFAMSWQHGRSRGSKRRVCWAGPGDVSQFMMDWWVPLSKSRKPCGSPDYNSSVCWALLVSGSGLFSCHWHSLNWELGIDIAPAIALHEQDAQNIPIKLTIKPTKYAFPISPSPLYPFSSSHVSYVSYISYVSYGSYGQHLLIQKVLWKWVPAPSLRRGKRV